MSLDDSEGNTTAGAGILPYVALIAGVAVVAITYNL